MYSMWGCFNTLCWLYTVRALCCIVTRLCRKECTYSAVINCWDTVISLYAHTGSRCPYTALERHVRTGRSAVKEPERFAKRQPSLSLLRLKGFGVLCHVLDVKPRQLKCHSEGNEGNDVDQAEIAGQSSQWNRIGRYTYEAVWLRSQPESHN